MSTITNRELRTVWLAIRHDGNEMDVQACSTLETAEQWLARVAIRETEWTTFYESLLRNGDGAGLSSDRTGMSDKQVLTAWAGDPTTQDGTVMYGEPDFGMEILPSDLFTGAQPV